MCFADILSWCIDLDAAKAHYAERQAAFDALTANARSVEERLRRELAAATDGRREAESALAAAEKLFMERLRDLVATLDEAQQVWSRN